MNRSWLWCVALVFLFASLATSGCGPPGRQAIGPAEGDVAGAPAAGETTDALPIGTGILAGTVPPATGGFPSVVILEPEESEGAAEGPVSPERPTEFPTGVPAVIDQYGMAFVPNMLVIRPGQTVEFRNGEDVLHNVHVTDRATNETIFNIATPMADSVFPHTFESTGTYSVLCDVHATMASFIIVTSSPYTAVADDDGTFELPGVPYGPYTLRVWNLDETRQSRRAVTLIEPRTEVLVEQNRRPGRSGN